MSQPEESTTKVMKSSINHSLKTDVYVPLFLANDLSA